jgi:hypothetical protein
MLPTSGDMLSSVESEGFRDKRAGEPQRLSLERDLKNDESHVLLSSSRSLKPATRDSLFCRIWHHFLWATH